MRLNVVGHVDGLQGEGLLGWACLPNALEQRLWVELLVDDCPVGIARAENYHPEAAAYGDGNYGFWLPLPPVLRDTSGVARMRVANTAHFVEPAVALSPVKDSEVLGAVSCDMGLSVSGWIRDAAEPERELQVSAWLDGKVLAKTSARQRRFRPESSDGHGFELTLPLELADGVSRYVQILDDEKRPLPGSPVLVCALPQGMSGWFATQKKLDASQRELVAEFLANYEQWLPKGLLLTQFAVWQKCFPASHMALPKGLRVGMVDSRTATAQMCTAMAADHDYLLWHHGESLYPQAVAHLLKALMADGAYLAYADGVVRQNDDVLLPLCRPAWDIYRFLCDDALGPCMVPAALVRDLPVADTTGSALRTLCVLAAHERQGIRHVPQFLSEADTAPLQNNEGHVRAASAWLRGRHEGVELEQLTAMPNRIHCTVSHTPLVSLLIPTRDKASLLRACLESLNSTRYAAVEVLILDNGSTEAETIALLQQAAQGEICRFPVRVLPCDGPFNYAAINNFGAQEATGEVLCLLNNDTEILQPEWLEEMVGVLYNSLTAEVGAVGAKLLWPNRLTQHAGVVVGMHQLAAHIGNQWPADDTAYMHLNCTTRQVSAVTAACLLTPRALYLAMGGMDAVRFPVAFNDVDYCLRLRRAGKAIVWTPHAMLMHHESASRGRDLSLPQKSRSAMEMHHFRSLWGAYDDPFYSPNLSLSTVLEPFSGLALPPRVRSIR